MQEIYTLKVLKCINKKATFWNQVSKTKIKTKRCDAFCSGWQYYRTAVVSQRNVLITIIFVRFYCSLHFTLKVLSLKYTTRKSSFKLLKLVYFLFLLFTFLFFFIYFILYTILLCVVCTVFKLILLHLSFVSMLFVQYLFISFEVVCCVSFHRFSYFTSFVNFFFSIYVPFYRCFIYQRFCLLRILSHQSITAALWALMIVIYVAK